MADLIDANEAKSLLGCDDATLQNFINNGTVRAQRVDGQLMLMREDVVNLGSTSPTSDSDEGTIILSGDSEDLSIDLGEVVDDSAMTVVQHSDSQADGMTESITFDDELEVVNFDDGQTEELSFDDTAATQPDALSFTDSNTAVNTDVDETVIATGTSTATNDFQTVDYGDDDEEGISASTVRRSARAQRVREEPVHTHWFWPTLLILTTIVVAILYVPYAMMMVVPRGEQADGAENHGVKDNIWTGIASSFAGFSVEPDQNAFTANNPSKTWIPISQGDITQTDAWRHLQYRGTKDSKQRAQDFVIANITMNTDPETGDEVPVSAVSADGDGNTGMTFSVEPTVQGNAEDGQRKVYKPVLKY
ncbi:MAG: hypothetical protein PF961_20065 [Planctomycetota bacterium]|nr:hypothetical protein [Planctomycetota bacterium]